MQRTKTINEVSNDDREKVEIYFSCRNLKDMDVFSKTDPQLKLYKKIGKSWNLVGKTEVIKDNLNPDFTKSFILDFVFETKQPLKVEVIDIDNESGTKFEFVGEAEFTLGELVGSVKGGLMKDLLDKGKKGGKVLMRAEKVSRSNDLLTLRFNVSDIGSYGMCSGKVSFIK